MTMTAKSEIHNAQVLRRPDELVLVRTVRDRIATLGFLFLNGRYLCATVEDTYRPVKVKHETRIPAGRYKVELRRAGGFHNRYGDHSRIGKIHKGMLWLRMPCGPSGDGEVSRVNADGVVERWTWIYFHCGRTAEHTSGCLLVGQPPLPFQTTTLRDSLNTYMEIYPTLARRVEEGELWLNIKDADHD